MLPLTQARQKFMIIIGDAKTGKSMKTIFKI